MFRRNIDQGKIDDAWNEAQYERRKQRRSPFSFQLSPKAKVLVAFLAVYVLILLVTPLIPISGKMALTGYLIRTIGLVFRCLLSICLAIWNVGIVINQVRESKAAAQTGYPRRFPVRPFVVLIGALFIFFAVSAGIDAGRGFYRYSLDRKQGSREAVVSLVDVGYGRRRSRSINPYIVVQFEDDGRMVRFEIDRAVARALQTEFGFRFGSLAKQAGPQLRISYYPATGVLETLEQEGDLTYLFNDPSNRDKADARLAKMPF